LRMEQKLKLAIRNGSLEAYLQPQVSADGKVIWAEALVRWFDAEDGAISPARFIPIAEETGLIHGLGQWMLEQVCFHLSQHKGYLGVEGIKGISVNLSGRQFYSRSLLRDIKRAMAESGVEPSQLEFELTESLVMDDVKLAIDVMRRLRDLGCRLSIDDFGTGYSSLAYLKRFPIHCLKIDRSFVEDIPHDPHGSEIATAIIAMAHKLHLEVVAEGVETVEQRDFLIAQGCESMQGYLFGKPKHIQEYVNAGKERFFSLEERRNRLAFDK
jgi:EAL domain-containing protein (putative c-di-GMP-specific phosphodiesterase class I)